MAGNLQTTFGVPSIDFSTVDFNGELINKPDSNLHGSARSPQGLSIVEIMTEMQRRDPDVILGFGGHAAAAGVTISNNKFNDFATLFNDVTSEFMANTDSLSTTQATAAAEDVFVIDPADVSISLIKAIDQMVPFGVEFERPLFMFKDITTIHPLLMGNIKQHIKFSVQPRIELIKWNGASDYDHLGRPNKMSVVGELGLSEYRGSTSVQMIID